MLIEPPQAVNTEYLEGKKKGGKKPSEIGQPALTVSSDLGKFWLCWRYNLWGRENREKDLSVWVACLSGGAVFFKGGGRGYYNQCYWSSHTYWNCSKLYSWLLSILEKGLNSFSRTVVCNRKLLQSFPPPLLPHTFPSFLEYGSYIHTCPATTITVITEIMPL